MIIDMHMHESTFSSDSYLVLEQMVSTARKLGMDGICITDHDSMGLKSRAEEYSKEVNFPIFVGVEYFSLDGDIVAFGIDHLPEGRISAQDFINYVKSQGGVCFSAHPFRNNNRGLEDLLGQVKGLDGVEVLNGSTSIEANEKAYAYAKRLGLQTIGASDCHVVDKIGCYATFFPTKISNVAELVNAVKKGGLLPATYIDGTYHVSNGQLKALAI